MAKSNRRNNISRIIGLRFVTIRARLIISFVLTVLLVAIAISGITTLLGTREGKQNEINQLESVVTLKQAEIDSWVKYLGVNLEIAVSGEGEVNDISTLKVASPGTEEYNLAYDRLQYRLRSAARSMNLFEELFFMDIDGIVRISTTAAHESEKHSIYDYFNEGMKGLYIQQPSYSLSLGKMIVVASSPVENNGNLLGVLAGRASLQSLNEIMLERAGLGETGETYLVGSNHRLLTSLRDSKYSIPQTYIKTPGSRASVEKHTNASGIYLNYSGVRVIGVYRWLPDLQVALLAEQEQSEALHATNTALLLIGLVGLVAVIAALIGAQYVTWSIVKPLTNLASTAKLIAEGDLNRLAKIERNDEVGTVANAFNTMTTRLRQVVINLERRTDQLRAINDTGRQISSFLHLDGLLKYVTVSLQKNFKYHRVGIVLKDFDSDALVLKSSSGTFGIGEDVSEGRLENKRIVVSAMQKGETILVNDIVNSELYASAETPGQTRAELVVPIRIGEKIAGVLDIEADHPNSFDDLDLFTAQTLADQVAIAIENARLYEQAEELATMKERTRLARDLHDAVSQTLFSASLVAEILPRLWERNPEEGKKRLEEIRQLTRGALAEMRTLLLELRPAALVDAEMSDLLRQLGESITGRARIPVEVEVNGRCSLTPDVKVALYRIAQESLNNVAKHAGARQARVTLNCRPDSVELVISDNGKGFDISSIRPDSLGLGIMRERAKGINASLKIEGTRDSGTRVSVSWRSPQSI